MCNHVSGWIEVATGKLYAPNPASHSAGEKYLPGGVGGLRERFSEFEWGKGCQLGVRNTDPTIAASLRNSILARYPDRRSLIVALRPQWEKNGHFAIDEPEDADRVPEEVEGDLHCTLETIPRLRVKSVGGYADFPSLTSAAGLESLASVGGYADFTRLTSAERAKIGSKKK